MTLVLGVDPGSRITGYGLVEKRDNELTCVHAGSISSSGKVPFYENKQKTPIHILIDSSGLAVHVGQLRKPPKSRDYRKLHLCVDELTGDVVACDLTSKSARDSTRVP